MLGGDEKLQAALSREAVEHDRAAEVCRRERRAVWLRLHEDGMTYQSLSELTGFGGTTIFSELRRARSDRETP